MPAENENPVSFLVVVGNSALVLSGIVLTDSRFSSPSCWFQITSLAKTSCEGAVHLVTR